VDDGFAVPLFKKFLQKNRDCLLAQNVSRYFSAVVVVFCQFPPLPLPLPLPLLFTSLYSGTNYTR
jgi:hypothetical protein